MILGRRPIKHTYNFFRNDMRYKHIIWDWNGTLLNDAGLSVEIFNEMLENSGREKISIEEYQNNFCFPVSEFYRKYGFRIDNDEFSRISKFYIESYNSRCFECELREGIRNFLEEAKSAGITQSILSAYEKSCLKSAVRYYGIEKYFIRIDGLDNIYAESKLSLGLGMIEELKSSQELCKEEIILIGDTTHDNEVAKALGIKSVLMLGGHNSPNKLKGTRIPVFNGVKELEEYILGTADNKNIKET